MQINQEKKQKKLIYSLKIYDGFLFIRYQIKYWQIFTPKRCFIYLDKSRISKNINYLEELNSNIIWEPNKTNDTLIIIARNIF